VSVDPSRSFEEADYAESENLFHQYVGTHAVAQEDQAAASQQLFEVEDSQELLWAPR